MEKLFRLQKLTKKSLWIFTKQNDQKKSLNKKIKMKEGKIMFKNLKNKFTAMVTGVKVVVSNNKAEGFVDSGVIS